MCIPINYAAIKPLHKNKVHQNNPIKGLSVKQPAEKTMETFAESISIVLRHICHVLMNTATKDGPHVSFMMSSRAAVWLTHVFQAVFVA